MRRYLRTICRARERRGRLLAEGHSTGEIATELGLSKATVRNYIADVLNALGVHSRLQAVIAARKAGLIEL